MKIPHRPLKKGHEKPLVLITLRNPSNERSVRYLALVDSGSDSCFFDAELGQALGIDVPTGRKGKIYGVVPDKWVPQYAHLVIIEYMGRTYSSEVGFVAGLSKHGYGILGIIGNSGGRSVGAAVQPYSFATRNRKNFLSRTPRTTARKPFSLALNDSAAALVLRSTK